MPHDTALPQFRQRSARPTPCPLGSIDPATSERPRALYLHVPFCFHKCHYCDFYSIVDQRERQPAFTERLGREIDALGAWWRAAGGNPPALTTLFVGGGTPTLLAPDLWRRLLDALAGAFGPAPEEFTVECNPETATAELLEVLAEGGVNRMSFGAQSFDRAHLATLERWHDPDSVARAVALARDAGITNLSLDLIYAVPGQTIDDWRRDLDAALALEPRHVSAYCLTYEPGTAMTRKLELGRITPASDELQADMQLAALDALEGAGLRRYEVSNFARPGFECRHNLAYWRQDPWLAAGPSASAHVGGHRWKIVPHLDRYLGAEEALAPVLDHEQPDARRALVERLMTGLRIAEGVDSTDALERAEALGAAPRLDAAAASAEAKGWLRRSEGRWAPTPEGFLFADALALELMSACDPG